MYSHMHVYIKCLLDLEPKPTESIVTTMKVLNEATTTHSPTSDFSSNTIEVITCKLKCMYMPVQNI